MPAEVQIAGRWLHLTSGFAAVGLGAVVMLLPKAGRHARWHRRVGSGYLTALGAVTAAVVVQGWRDARAARAAAAGGDAATAAARLRWHLILMGASYVGAWSGFFATNPVLGVGEWQVWFYVFGPTVVGGVVIGRAAVRVR